MTKKKHKLGVVVPYRDRYDQLVTFKKRISDYLDNVGIEYELIVIEQDDAKTFNRGKLLNVGFTYAKKMNCDYVVFHDVDMLPINVDYLYSEHPVHLAAKFKSNDPNFNRVIFDEYFGGVTLFSVEDFEQINGYSNEYWGWGYEDTDLLYRCKINNIKLDTKEIPLVGGNTAALKFNGVNANVEFKNVINMDSNVTFFVTFYPDDIKCNHEKYDDTYSIFTIPGCDLSINYNSYSRYNFQMYDFFENVIYVNSDILPNHKTNICVTINPINKLVKMYQNGVLVGEKKYEKELFNYNSIRKAYLGCSNVIEESTLNNFSGLISSFASYNKCLDESEIKELSKNQYFGLTQNFGDYNSSDNLVTYYDAKFIKNYQLVDLVNYKNNAKIVNCEIVGYTFDDIKHIQIPFRRDCEFELLSHKENGYVDGAWKDITTRYNQMRYHNEVFFGYRNTKEDGLSNLNFKELGSATINNQTHITVSI
jgi:hypothetical protein